MRRASEEAVFGWPHPSDPSWLVRGDPRQDSTLAKIISNPGQDSEASIWAVRVARMRGASNVVDLLRERLSAVEKDAAEHEKAVLGGIPADAPEYRTSFTTALHPLGIDDRHFDELLVIYQGLGGKCSISETLRLRTFGYGCDPQERLAELLAENK